MKEYKHIFITGAVNSEKYKPPKSIGSGPNIPNRDRVSHSDKLLKQFDAIWKENDNLKKSRTAQKIATREGIYISFASAAGHPLITKSLENFGRGIRLLNIKEIPFGENQKQTIATVYIPNGQEGFFIKKIEEYKTKDTLKGEPKNKPLVDSIEDVSIALLERLWTDNPELIPENNSKWCEAWLNIDSQEELKESQIAAFLNTLRSIGIDVKQDRIFFPERAVLLINANRNQLVELMCQSDLLAEFRAGQEPAGFWVNESKSEQQRWVDDLLNRIEVVESNVKVCLLDSGVNNGHPLLRPVLDDSNTLTVNSNWGTDDHFEGAGHGTLMAGIACYGQIEPLLLSQSQVLLTHSLCSVKILPRPKQEGTPKELWGYITAQGIYRAEIQNPKFILFYCMSITSNEEGKDMVGRPSSWSGAVDNLAFGEGANQRLIIISAGNINDEVSWQDYPNSNNESPIQNPAQSWNALVIGAYTDKVQVNEKEYQDYTPLAKKSELSPFSSTSLIWENKWPLKPDVVFEGGNLLRAPNGSVTQHEDLELLSTSKTFNQFKIFNTINATSAAAAQASWFAAKVAYEYPNAWAETIRGLIIHSARWNEAMLTQVNAIPGDRRSYGELLRTFGFGVPDLERALYSKESALTFIAQETIQPFNLKSGSKNDAETNEIHFFNLPWPKDLLLSLGQTTVKLRITLSYFIEPGAGEIGWKDKYRYQSYGLRFDVNNEGESESDFRKRVNFAAREEDEKVNGNSGSKRWVVGKSNRLNGSVHSDFWEGTAADLATCNLIAVFPVIGWWRERKNLGKVETKTRYALIISLDTPKEDVELYTTVKNMIEIPIEIKSN